MTIVIMKNFESEDQYIEISSKSNIIIKEFMDLLSIRIPVRHFVDIIKHCGYKHNIHFNRQQLNRSYVNYIYKNGRLNKNGNLHKIEKIKEMLYDKDKLFYIDKFSEPNKILESEDINISFPRESVRTRFLYKILKINNDKYNKDIELILVGLPDKILRYNQSLIIEEDKPGDLRCNKHDFFPDILQSYIYLKSKFSVLHMPVSKKVGPFDTRSTYDDSYQTSLDEMFDESILNPNDYDKNTNIFFEIHHQKEILRVYIKDPRLPINIDNKVMELGIYCDNNIEEFLKKNIEIFLDIIIGAIDNDHYDDFGKCKLCRRNICPINLLRYHSRLGLKRVKNVEK